MSVITSVPLHLYLTMLAFSVTIGVLVAIELRDQRVVASRPQRGPATRPDASRWKDTA